MATPAGQILTALHAAYKRLREGLKAPEIPIPTAGSTALGKVRWDPLTWDLRIQFRRKAKYGSYVYPAVHVNTVLGMVRARSKGRYFHRRIKRYSRR